MAVLTNAKRGKKTRSHKRTVAKSLLGKPLKKNSTASYNQHKIHDGRQYTGMRIGGTHKWYYDRGEWKETKVTPDLWRISYSVTKRRAGKAPGGSGAPVGTGYHWFIFAHQVVTKLDADDYSTSLIGLKYKLAHKRASKNAWNVKTTTQRNHLIKFLKTMLSQLENAFVPIDIEYEGKRYKGEGIPIPGTCQDGVCFMLDISLNDEHYGVIRSLKSGWKMDEVKDQKLVDAIGQEIMAYYE